MNMNLIILRIKDKSVYLFTRINSSDPENKFMYVTIAAISLGYGDNFIHAYFIEANFNPTLI
jgi:hypothetical protein